MTRNDKRIFVLLPAYREAGVIGGIVSEIRQRYPHFSIVVIDDCSYDTTAQEAALAGAHVLKHCINLGQGAAVKTGVTFAIQNAADIIVHMDSDGQHVVSEIDLLLNPLLSGKADIILGSRFLANQSNVPTLRRLVLKAGILFTWFFSGLRLTDTHNGFRASTREAAQKIAINENRMAHASEILHEIVRHNLSYVEVPVTVLYTKYSLLHGQKSSNAFHIVTRLLWRKLFLE
ncbi:glycosyltransferase family 2 protein [Candidatus Uhrbacteria bacterium]|nr:glycosyltransferase family 2 protein [Candidatus Uhrbacteria bacterium]